MKDDLKIAVRDMAFDPFAQGLPIKVEGEEVPYEVHNVSGLSIMVRVPGTTNAAGISSGPRYFEVIVKEKY